MHINWIGKSSELKLHYFCLFDAYSMPKDVYSVRTYVDLLKTFHMKVLFFIQLSYLLMWKLLKILKRSLLHTSWRIKPLNQSYQNTLFWSNKSFVTFAMGINIFWHLPLAKTWSTFLYQIESNCRMKRD